MKRPLVSVVMPTHNREAMLDLAIESVRSQTLDDLELLIVDDASTDGTAEMLARKAPSDRRIRILRLAVNSGCDAARNMGVSQARGRYLAFLDDDDLFLPERLEQAVRRLEEAPELDVVFSHYGFIDARGRALPWRPKFMPIGDAPTPGATVFAMLYCDWGWIPTCTLTVRAERLANLFFLEARRSDNDAIFNTQLAALGATFAQLSTTLALVRRDRSYASMSRDRKALLSHRRASLVFLRNWLVKEKIESFNDLHDRAWSNQLINEAEFQGGLPGLWLLIRAIRYWPSNPKIVRSLWHRVLARR
jgi:glycosyltransferase involved in cell wall biosynthesis